MSTRQARVVLSLLLTCVPAPGCRSSAVAPQRVADAELRASESIGRANAASVLQGSVRLVAPELETVVQKVTDEIAAAVDSDVRYRVYILNGPTRNMFVFPSGDIFVFAGFLESIDNRDELAFALAHEIAHVRQRHGLAQMRRALELERQRATWTLIVSSIVSAAVQAPLAAAGPGGIAQPVIDKVVGFSGFAGEFAARVATKVSDLLVVSVVAQVKSGYSQANEAEADELAIAYMRRAGYDPRAAVSVVRRLAKWHAE